MRGAIRNVPASHFVSDTNGPPSFPSRAFQSSARSVLTMRDCLFLRAQVQQGGLGDGSPLLRELKDGKLQSTIHAFWKRLGSNMRRSAMTQLQALCWTATSADYPAGLAVENGEGKTSEVGWF